MLDLSVDAAVLAEVLRKAQLPVSRHLLVVIALVLSMSIINGRDAEYMLALDTVLDILFHTSMSRATGQRTSVIGVPKTIDGDLKNAQVATSFGFDTACKVMSAPTYFSCLCSLQDCHGKHGLP